MNWIERHKRLIAFLLVAVLLLGWRQYDRHFTPERWADAGSSHRGKLVGSLLRQYNGLEGMTRAEVEALLGEDASGGTAYEERLLPAEAAWCAPCWSIPPTGRDRHGRCICMFTWKTTA